MFSDFTHDEEEETRSALETFKEEQRRKRNLQDEGEGGAGDPLADRDRPASPVGTSEGQEQSPLASLMDAAKAPEDYILSFAGDHDPKLERKAREWFYKVGMPLGTAKALSSLFNMRAERRLNESEREQERRDVERRLRQEWGDALFEDRVGRIRNLLGKLDAEAIEILENSGLGNDEQAIRRLVRFAETKVLR